MPEGLELRIGALEGGFEDRLGGGGGVHFYAVLAWMVLWHC